MTVNPPFLRLQDTRAAVGRRAARDVFFVPDAKIFRTDSGFVMNLILSGFDGRNIDVLTTPEEVVIYAWNEKCTSGRCGSQHINGAVCESGSKSLYRRFGFPELIDAGKVTAKLRGELLIIEATNRTSEEVLVLVPEARRTL
jgi:HSP20 family molecular chaperone IbpA